MKKQILMAFITFNMLAGFNQSQAQWQLTGNAGTVSSNFIGTTDNVSLKFKTKNLARMIILAGGNVGIGTTAPGYKLQVIGTGRFEDGVKIGGFGVVNVDAPGIVAGRFKIDSAGNVGIGTSTPSSKLTVVGGSIDVTGEFIVRNSLAPSTNFGQLTHTFGGGGNTHLDSYGTSELYFNRFSLNPVHIGDLSTGTNFLPNGNVGIGSQTPTAMLSVNGTADKPGGGSWAAFSDSRLKKEVTSYEDGLSTLLKISPVKYHYNELAGCDTKQEYVGVIAQQLQEIAPYMVGNFEKNGKEYLKVDNSAMTYMLINSVKEQQRLIESKDVKLAYLQNQLDELKSIVNSCCENNLSKNQNTITESSNGNLLFQNQPNPFNQSTIISFQIIKDANNPKILFRNLNGELVKSITISQKGKGQVTVDASELKPGTYTYTLIVNNQSVDTKLMVITK